jgi:hypothetical protein
MLPYAVQTLCALCTARPSRGKIQKAKEYSVREKEEKEGKKKEKRKKGEKKKKKKGSVPSRCSAVCTL